MIQREVETNAGSWLEAERQIHKVYDVWGLRHEADFLKLTPYDPNNPHQLINSTEIAPTPSIEHARLFGRSAMGELAYDQLVGDLSDDGLADYLFDRAYGGESSLVATFHLTNVLDTPLSHNALFVAKNSPACASRNVLISNGLMTRMAIPDNNGEWHMATSVMAFSGKLLIGTPPEGAIASGMDRELVGHLNRNLTTIYTGLLEEGIVVHRALTDTRARQIIHRDGSKARMLPRISDGLARTVVKRSPFVVGAPIDVLKPGHATGRILSPRMVKSPEDVHILGQEAAEALSEMSGDLVVYGLPEGYKVVEPLAT